MEKLSNRERILAAGLKVVHVHGYAGASVRDIVQAAGVPQGTFTNHFTSKEEFALEIIDLYFARGRELVAQTLRNDALPPLQRLGDYIDANKERLDHDESCSGCLFGNFSAETVEHSELIRQRLLTIFAELKDNVAYCLEAAVASGDLPADFDCQAVAGFIVSSLQGANLLAKAERSSRPLEQFRQVLFTQMLR